MSFHLELKIETYYLYKNDIRNSFEGISSDNDGGLESRGRDSIQVNNHIDMWSGASFDEYSSKINK